MKLVVLKKNESNLLSLCDVFNFEHAPPQQTQCCGNSECRCLLERGFSVHSHPTPAFLTFFPWVLVHHRELLWEHFLNSHLDLLCPRSCSLSSLPAQAGLQKSVRKNQNYIHTYTKHNMAEVSGLCVTKSKSYILNSHC